MAQSNTINTGQVLPGSIKGRQNWAVTATSGTSLNTSGLVTLGSAAVTVNGVMTTISTTTMYVVPAGKRLRVLLIEITNTGSGSANIPANSRIFGGIAFCQSTTTPTSGDARWWSARVHASNNTGTAQIAETSSCYPLRTVFPDGTIDFAPGTQLSFNVTGADGGWSSPQFYLAGYLYDA
jgi:hypothetical protein